MTDVVQERRRSVRRSNGLSAVVKGFDRQCEAWEEETELVNLSKVGASFQLANNIELGRLVLIEAKDTQEFPLLRFRPSPLSSMGTRTVPETSPRTRHNRPPDWCSLYWKDDPGRIYGQSKQFI